MGRRAPAGVGQRARRDRHRPDRHAALGHPRAHDRARLRARVHRGRRPRLAPAPPAPLGSGRGPLAAPGLHGAPGVAGSDSRRPARLNPLRQHGLVRLAIGAPLVLLAGAGLSFTVANARESRDFEERAARAPATVVDTRREENAWRQHVTVQFSVDGETRLERAPVLDSEVYKAGQSVVVLYEDGRVLLDE